MEDLISSLERVFIEEKIMNESWKTHHAIILSTIKELVNEMDAMPKNFIGDKESLELTLVHYFIPYVSLLPYLDQSDLEEMRIQKGEVFIKSPGIESTQLIEEVFLSNFYKQDLPNEGAFSFVNKFLFLHGKKMIDSSHREIRVELDDNFILYVFHPSLDSHDSNMVSFHLFKTPKMYYPYGYVKETLLRHLEMRRFDILSTPFQRIGNLQDLILSFLVKEKMKVKGFENTAHLTDQLLFDLIKYHNEQIFSPLY